MKIQYFMIQLFLLLSLFACKDDDEVQFSGDAIRISGQIAGINSGDAMTRFRGGAGVGMFIADIPETNTAGTFSLAASRVRNEKYMQSADGLVGDNRVYWGNTGKIGVVGYYPWQKGMQEEPENALFSLIERQDTLSGTLSGYQESDFLWAQTVAEVNTNPVGLTFRHLMSKVIINLKSDASIPGDMVGGKVKILGSRIAARINLETGEVTPEGNTGEITATESEQLKTGCELSVKAVLVPQTVGQGVQFLEIRTLGGYSYTWHLPENMTFESGKQLTLDVEIISGECEVTVGEITDWTESATPLYGEAIESLPVFKLFDLYNIDGIRGIVISTDETGKHGLVMSLDKSPKMPWLSDENREDDLEDNDSYDGIANMEAIIKQDPTLELFPVVKWCMDRNPSGVIKWYLPAEKELELVIALLAEDTDLFNAKLEAMGGSPVEYDPEIDDLDYYWSSTLYWGRVSVGRYAWWSSSYITTKSPTEEYAARAFYKF